MNRRRRRLARTIARALVCLAAGLAAGGASSAPLTEEDVVRMWVAGGSVAEIADAIGTSEVAFDLSPEMLSELRRAGLPEELIRAMQRRGAETDRATEPPASADVEQPAAPRPVLRVTLHGRKGTKDAAAKADAPRPTLIYPARVIDDGFAEQQGLGRDREDRRIVDLTVFLACRTTDHVPDQWRSVSPLGRDFVGMPRHRLLALSGGAQTMERDGMLAKLRRWVSAPLTDQDDLDLLRLDLPPALVAELRPDVAHDLVVGLAIEVGGRQLVVAIAERAGVVVPSAGLELDARLWSRVRRTGLDVGADFGE